MSVVSSIPVLIFLFFLSLLVICRFVLYYLVVLIGAKVKQVCFVRTFSLVSLANSWQWSWTNWLMCSQIQLNWPSFYLSSPETTNSNRHHHHDHHHHHHCGLITIYFCFVDFLPLFSLSLAVVSLDFYCQFSNKANFIDSLESFWTGITPLLLSTATYIHKLVHKVLVCLSVFVCVYQTKSGFCV